jgi:hypothetical protein
LRLKTAQVYISEKSDAETPLWRKSLTSGVNRNLPDRYRQLVAIDLVKESDDIQLCPGEVVMQAEKPTPTGSPSFNSFLLNTLSTPPASSAAYASSKQLLQSARAIHGEMKQQAPISSSFPNTSQLAKKIQVGAVISGAFSVNI